jgi:proline iminopeptidase
MGIGEGCDRRNESREVDEPAGGQLLARAVRLLRRYGRASRLRPSSADRSRSHGTKFRNQRVNGELRRVLWECLRACPETEPRLRAVPRNGSICADTMRRLSGNRLDVRIQGDAKRERVTALKQGPRALRTRAWPWPFQQDGGLTSSCSGARATQVRLRSNAVARAREPARWAALRSATILNQPKRYAAERDLTRTPRESVKFIVSYLAAALVTALPLHLGGALQTGSNPSESRISVGSSSLYARAIGQGPPVIILHGGPDFDHGYLLPGMDRLTEGFRLIYYDQRGRGRSAERVRPEEVTLASDVEDIDRVRQYFRLDTPALLGHSWGAVLALEYALRHPTRVSRLILMNPAPASAYDVAMVRKEYLERLGGDMDRQRAIVAGAAYQAGDPEAVAARYRIHFKPALKRPEDYEQMMATMKAGFISQGKEGILKARAVEDQLMRDTWQVAGYDLLPKLRSLRVPTLVIAGDHDFMAGAAEHIARAIPNAHLVTISDCGHFAFLECADEVRHAIEGFFRRRR